MAGDTDFARLRQMRELAAAANRDLKLRALERPKVKREAMDRLTAQPGVTKTDAKDRHMEDEQMAAFDTETAQIEYVRDLMLADAEAEALEIRNDIALTLKTAGV